MRPVAWVVVALVALGAMGTSAAAVGTVDHQAWSQSQPVATFVPKANEIYVAITAGLEEARSFVHIDTTGLSATDLQGATLVLKEASGDELQPATAGIAACALAAPFAGDGQLHGGVPAADCTLRTDASRDQAGSWTVELGIFADRWTGSVNNGIVLFPEGASQTSAFRVAFDTSHTTFQGAAAGTTQPPPAPDQPAATGISAAIGAPEPGAPFQPNGVFSASATPPGATAAPAVGSSTPSSSSLSRARPTPVGLTAPLQGRSTTGSSLITMTVFAVGAVVVGGSLRSRRRPDGVPGTSAAGSRIASVPLPIVLGGLALLFLPLLTRDAVLFKIGVVLIFFVAAIGLHILVNWVGQLSLAHAAMVGIPSFAILTVSSDTGISPIYLLPLAILLGAAVGAFIALPTLRAKDLQVALVTLVAGIGLDRYFFAQTWLVGGAGGRASSTPSLGPFRFTTTHSLYPVLALVTMGAVGAAWVLMHSKLARAWALVRADPNVAAAFGVPVVKYRIAAYAVGGGFAGLAGGLTAMWIQRLGQNAFPDTLSFSYLLMAVLAGPGFVGGLAAATAMLQGGQQFAANLFGGGAGKVVDTILTYGGPVALIMVIARYQEGFNGLGRRLMPRIRAVKLIGRDEHEQHTGDAISLSLIAGAALIVAGFITIALAWHHISRTNQLWVQNQEILSGGVVGLGLILIGVGLFIRDRLARNHVLLARQLERLMGPSSAAAAAGGDIEVVDGKDDADGPRAQNVDFVAVPPALESAKPANGRRRRARVAG